MTSIGVIRAIVVCLKANMVVKTTAIYIPLRTVQEKQYFVIPRGEESKSQKDEESKSRRALALAYAIVNVKQSFAFAYKPPQ